MITILGLCFVPLLGSCTILGFLLSPSSAEQKIPAQFPLAEHEKEGLYIVIRVSPASGVDVDVPELLAKAIIKDLLTRVKMQPQYIFNDMEIKKQASVEYFSWSQVEQSAKRAGAGLILFVEILEYEMVPLQQRKFYMGKLNTRSILMNADTGEMLWPADQYGRIVQAAVEFEKNGRAETIWRLTSATAHCIVREFYNCPKVAYSVSEEVKSMDTLMKDLD